MTIMPRAADIELAHSMVGARLNALNKRPWFDSRTGKSYIAVCIGKDEKGKLHYAKRELTVNTTALLQYDEWKDIDRSVIPAAVQRMTGMNDLRSRGLTHNLGSIGQTVSLWDKMSDMTPAEISMSAVTGAEKDTPAYKPTVVPVPIVHKAFQVELRRLEASRRFGESIDVSAAELSGRLVAEASETMLFNGTGFTVQGNPIYGYTTHPDRNEVDMNRIWDELDGAAGENVYIIEDVMAMQQASRNARYYGPWVLYIPAHYEAKLDEDYRGSSSSDTRTVRERLLALSGIEDIKVADFLTGDNVLLISMRKDVVDLAIAQDITTVQWTTLGGMQEEFRVMAVWVPRLKSDFDGRSGITHLYPIPS